MAMMDAHVSFLLQAALISLSGVMAPGPITAATLDAGMSSRHAGGLIAVGHGLVEFPLMVLVMAGMGTLLASKVVTVGIGLVGGFFLMVMGWDILRGLAKPFDAAKASSAKSPIWTGIVLTGGNPYFLLWWVTIGLTLTSRALQLGVVAFGLFAVIHWLCDFVWLEVLSFASFKGTTLVGDRVHKVVLGVCSVALVCLGLFFVVDAFLKL